MKNSPFKKGSLLLAPMEGVGDISFRKAIATIGGFDEAVRAFIRVPKSAHVKSLAKAYIANEIAPLPLVPQIMGSDPDLMGAMAHELEKRSATRVDLNCGCPSNTVTGRGAGSSLLKDPNRLFLVAKSMVKSVTIPISVKMRSGFLDSSLLKENLLAAQEAGVSFITLHPRTKVEKYDVKSNWELIALAKTILKIPLIGNGDIFNKEDAKKMMELTNCDGLMIGRGSLINPFIFHEIRGHSYKLSSIKNYLRVYVEVLPQSMPKRIKINKLKQLLGFLLQKNRDHVLKTKFIDLDSILTLAFSYIKY